TDRGAARRQLAADLDLAALQADQAERRAGERDRETVAEAIGELETAGAEGDRTIGLAAVPMRPAEPALAAHAGIVAAVDRDVGRVGRRIVGRERGLEVRDRGVKRKEAV